MRYVFFVLAAVSLFVSYNCYSELRDIDRRLDETVTLNRQFGYSPQTMHDWKEDRERQAEPVKRGLEMEIAGGLCAAAIFVVIGLKLASQVKRCPSCKETINRTAVKCKHCGSAVAGIGATISQEARTSQANPIAQPLMQPAIRPGGYCGSCGSPLEPAAKFCGGCGAALS
jgi:hypothetical protein